MPTGPTEVLSLSARLERAADRRGGLVLVSGTDHERVPWAALHDDARAGAAALQARGITPRDHVAILGATSRALVSAVQATWLAGACAVVLPLPMRMGSLEEFVAQTRARVRGADAVLLLIDDELAAFYAPVAGDPPTLPLSAVVGAPGRSASDRFEPPPDDASRLAVLQFTSGSTSEPKGVMLPEHTLVANLDSVAAGTQLDVDGDVIVSWLPLYHDMGLVGVLTLAMTNGAELILAAPQDFMARPAAWMEWISAFGGTATAGPNFSYVLAARGLRRATGLDLSRLRLALNGAEPIDPATVEDFCAAGAPFGLRPESAFCAFGMAELAIGGTFPRPLTGMRVDAIDRRVLEAERLAAPADPYGPATRRLPLLGRPLDGLALRICDPASGSVMTDREVGELEFRGTSVTPGYYRHPEATAELFHGEWLRTGDLAYVVEGELVLCGRLKDVIIVGGRNLFPEDVERAVAGVEGVRAGNVIAFGIDSGRGKEAVVVVAETRSDDPALVRKHVQHRVLEATGVPACQVVLVPPGTLPKTSSGKVQRQRCRQRYLDADLKEV